MQILVPEFWGETEILDFSFILSDADTAGLEPHFE